MPLSEDQHAVAAQWVVDKNLRCGCCGSNHLDLGSIVAPTPAQPGPKGGLTPLLGPGGAVVPVLEVECAHCAHIFYLNAKRVGVWRTPR